jgi:hypothetical protein
MKSKLRNFFKLKKKIANKISHITRKEIDARSSQGHPKEADPRI